MVSGRPGASGTSPALEARLSPQGPLCLWISHKLVRFQISSFAKRRQVLISGNFCQGERPRCGRRGENASGTVMPQTRGATTFGKSVGPKDGRAGHARARGTEPGGDLASGQNHATPGQVNTQTWEASGSGLRSGLLTLSLPWTAGAWRPGRPAGPSRGPCPGVTPLVKI